MISSNKFSIVLDKTPNLYSLTAEKNALQKITVNWTHIPICNQLSQKIRSLKLYSSSQESWKLSRYEVNEILNSFARKCEHVSLDALLSIETIAFILQICRNLLIIINIIAVFLCKSFSFENKSFQSNCERFHFLSTFSTESFSRSRLSLNVFM
jgi:hypothetical protein